MLTNIKDFTKPKKKKPKYENGVLVETEEELKNWGSI